MKKIIVLLLLISNCAIAQQKIKMKEALPKAGLLNKKIKQTKWYFSTDEIRGNILDLSGNAGQPDILNFQDANKFQINLQDGTSFSGTYLIFDLHDIGTHDTPPNYKTFKIAKTQTLSQRGKKLAAFLQQPLNVHYDLEEKTMDFNSDSSGPVVPAN